MKIKEKKPFPQDGFVDLAKIEDSSWWFCGRNKLLLWVVKNKVKPFANFLEIGCGTGFVLSAVRNEYPDIELYGSEYFDEGLMFARDRIPTAHFRQLDATQMNEVAVYDTIGSFDVLEHIEQDELVLDNIYRALKPDGSFVLTVPQHQWLWSNTDVKACHVRRYSRKEMLSKLKSSGFQIVYVTSFVSLLVPLMWLSRSRKQRQEETEGAIAELRPSIWLNTLLGGVMTIERRLIKLGINFPIGGSLLVVARKAQ